MKHGDAVLVTPTRMNGLSFVGAFMREVRGINGEVLLRVMEANGAEANYLPCEIVRSPEHDVTLDTHRGSKHAYGQKGGGPNG